MNNQSAFLVPEFHPPYDYFRFPGQHEDERIFYAARAAKIILLWKAVFVCIVWGFAAIIGAYLMDSAYDSLKFVGQNPSAVGIQKLLIGTGPFLSFLWIISFIFAFFWAYAVWRKTIFLVTNKRLTQFVFTTPWTNYQLSLSLDKVVDTAAITHSYLQRFLGVGNLFARSAAGAQGDFLVPHIEHTRDLHNWLTKLIYEWEAASKKGEALINFKPFDPHWENSNVKIRNPKQ